MNKILIIIIFLNAGLLYAQQFVLRLNDMQKIFFVSESSSLAAASVNPAAMSIRSNNNGVVLGYDFGEIKNQGNTSVFLAMHNFGFSYRDMYDINNIRLQNYALSLSAGNKFISVGTTDRYTVAQYSSSYLKKFSFDLGLILKPSDFFSLGVLARNLGQTGLDSLNYLRNYSAGFGLTFFNDALNLFGEAGFTDRAKFDNLTEKIGLVIVPLDLFEFRGGIIFNSDQIIYLGKNNTVGYKNLKYRSFISLSFLIKNTIRVTVAAGFNDSGTRTRIYTILNLPL